MQGYGTNALYLLVIVKIDLLVIDPCKNLEEARPAMEELFKRRDGRDEREYYCSKGNALRNDHTTTSSAQRNYHVALCVASHKLSQSSKVLHQLPAIVVFI